MNYIKTAFIKRRENMKTSKFKSREYYKHYLKVKANRKQKPMTFKQYYIKRFKAK